MFALPAAQIKAMFNYTAALTADPPVMEITPLPEGCQQRGPFLSGKLCLSSSNLAESFLAGRLRNGFEYSLGCI